MEEGPPVEYRFATRADLRAVLAAYWKCFDETQRLRTVAASPFLFRLFYGREMKAGRCKVAVALDGSDLIGFAIVRENGGPNLPWLLSAIGVVPERRKGGVAKRLFEMVATRPITLTVEEGGPVAFYESLGLRRTGEQTLLYVKKAHRDALLALATSRESEPALESRTINWSARFNTSSALTPGVASKVAKGTRFGRTSILQLPGRITVPPDNSILTVYEFAFATA